MREKRERVRQCECESESCGVSNNADPEGLASEKKEDRCRYEPFEAEKEEKHEKEEIDGLIDVMRKQADRYVGG